VLHWFSMFPQAAPRRPCQYRSPAAAGRRSAPWRRLQAAPRHAPPTAVAPCCDPCRPAPGPARPRSSRGAPCSRRHEEQRLSGLLPAAAASHRSPGCRQHPAGTRLVWWGSPRLDHSLHDKHCQSYTEATGISQQRQATGTCVPGAYANLRVLMWPRFGASPVMSSQRMTP